MLTVLNKCKSITELFDKVIRKIGQYDSLRHFYDSFKVTKDLHLINTPTLFINNKEDPFCSFSGVPIEQLYANENFISLFTNKDGHIEYYSGLSFDWWAYKIALEYIQVFKENNS